MRFKFKLLLLILCIMIFVGIMIYVNVSNLAESNQEQQEKQTEIQKQNDNLPEEKPEVLELTQDKVEIEVGAIFDFTQYIKIAEDKYGYNIKDKIKVNGTVPTNKEGHYQVEYKLELDNGKSISKILDVQVKKFNE